MLERCCVAAIAVFAVAVALGCAMRAGASCWFPFCCSCRRWMFFYGGIVVTAAVMVVLVLVLVLNSADVGGALPSTCTPICYNGSGLQQQCFLASQKLHHTAY